MNVSQDRLDKGLWWDKALYAVHGCRPRSPECFNCWAAMLAHQRQHNPHPTVRARHQGITVDGRFSGKIILDPDALGKLSTTKSYTWAVWDDLFYGDEADAAWCAKERMPFTPVPDEYIAQVFAAMGTAPEQTFVVLTKRSGRMRDWTQKWAMGSGVMRPHIIGGVTAGTQASARERIPHLAHSPFAVKMVSVEPMLEPLDFGPWLAPPESTGTSYGGQTEMVGGAPLIDWVVVGCESKHNGKLGRLGLREGTFKDRNEWLDAAIDLVADCREAGVKVFVKQIPHASRVALEKRLHCFPEGLRYREVPTILRAHAKQLDLWDTLGS